MRIDLDRPLITSHKTGLPQLSDYVLQEIERPLAQCATEKHCFHYRFRSTDAGAFPG